MTYLLIIAGGAGFIAGMITFSLICNYLNDKAKKRANEIIRSWENEDND